MKHNLLTLVIVWFSLNLSIQVDCQTTFEKHEVAKPFPRSAGLGLADVDQDGDQDILAGSGVAGLFWFENQGGKPLKWVSHTVDAGIKLCLSVRMSDIDNDGKGDILATSWDENSVYWYRNLGNQVWEKKLISNQCGEAHELFVKDMDGDGYDDVLVAAVTNNEILLFRNPGPGSTAWPRQQVSNSCGGSRSVAAGDLDGDSRMDIVGAAFSGNKITIWRNLGGNPVQWQPFDLISGYAGAHRVEIVDLNQDGKLDIIGWGYLQGCLRWWENTGANFSGWIMHAVDNMLNTSCVGEAKDIDLDGDLDIVSTSYANLVVWYENNDGKATDWRKRTIDTGMAQPWMAFASDLDGDLDVDVIAGGDSGNEIRWYENHPNGRMDSYLNYSGGKMNTGIFLPEGYSESGSYELLIAFPGEGDGKTNPSLRDYLIPVSENRSSIILAADYPKAVQPGYEFAAPAQVNEVISYARTRFSVDTARIYLLGAACQGQPVLKGTLSGVFPVKGAIAVNPEVGSFNTADWTGQSKPLAIASSRTDPYYAEAGALAGQLWQEGKKVRLFPFDGSGSDYLSEELASLTIRCMNYIDSADFLAGINDMKDPAFGHFTVRIFPNPALSGPVKVSMVLGQKSDIRLSVTDLAGRTIFQESRMCQAGDQTLSMDFQKIAPGIYFLKSQNGHENNVNKLVIR